MTTAIDLIKGALKDINVLGAGETASPEDAADALDMLNLMIGQWQAKRLYVFGQRAVSFTPDGSQSYTIGAGQTINTTLPVAIDSATFDAGGLTYPVEVLTERSQWEAIRLKALGNAYPSAIFFQRDYPTGTVYVWPQPSAGSIKLLTRDILSGFASLADAVSVPDEYKLPMRFSLAELIAPMFGKSVTPDLKMQAKAARATMKAVNLTVPVLGMPAELTGQGRFNILSGDAQ